MKIEDNDSMKEFESSKQIFPNLLGGPIFNRTHNYFFSNNNSDSSKSKYNFFYQKDCGNSFPNFRIISSLFTKKNIENEINNFTINTDNNSVKNSTLNNNNNYIEQIKIYNVIDRNIFQIKIYNESIKYYPIRYNMTESEKIITYDPKIESSKNFEIIDYYFEKLKNSIFYVKDHNISTDNFNFLKNKYVVDTYTRKNIINYEEIFKYLFEELKLNLSSIDINADIDSQLTNCSKLIKDINETVEFIKIHSVRDNKENDLSKKNNNNNNTNNNSNSNSSNHKIFFLGDINSNILTKNMNVYNSPFKVISHKTLRDNNDSFSDIDPNEINNDDKNLKDYKDNCICPVCNKKFNTHCGLGGHMSKRHPKKKDNN